VPDGPHAAGSERAVQTKAPRDDGVLDKPHLWFSPDRGA
jgi:hypothetical protein